MTKRYVITLIIVCVGALAMFFFARHCMERYRPITKTDEWKASVTHSGHTETIPVYEMAGFSNRLLVQLPDDLRQRYEWFGIYRYGVTEYKYGVSRLSAVKRFPYRHYKHDMAFGVGIEDAKTEDNWIIEQTDKMVRFYNDDFSIVVEKNDD